MRFYTKNHNHYCGVDLHAKTMYLCIFDRDGQIVLHKNMKSRPDTFLAAIEPFRDDLVVGVECMFTWYWLADLCRSEGIEFVLGHALYMKAIHGGKAKNDAMRIRLLKYEITRTSAGIWRMNASSSTSTTPEMNAMCQGGRGVGADSGFGMAKGLGCSSIERRRVLAVGNRGTQIRRMRPGRSRLRFATTRCSAAGSSCRYPGR